MAAARLWMGQPAGGSFGAAARLPRRRPEPFETAIKSEPPASPAPGVEDASGSSDEELLSAVKRVELAAAGAKAAEVMERMGAGAAGAAAP